MGLPSGNLILYPDLIEAVRRAVGDPRAAVLALRELSVVVPSGESVPVALARVWLAGTPRPIWAVLDRDDVPCPSET